MTVLDEIKPVYTVYRYTDFLYRIVKFKRNSDGVRLVDREPDDLPMTKFEQSYCRARSMILQYALCNKWDYFITITVDPEKFDRYDLEPIAKSLKQWFLDYNKKFKCKIDFLLVPEQHKDGAWHFHGLIRGIPYSHLSLFPDDPYRPKIRELHQKGYFNWVRLMNKIGFCSLAPIQSAVAVGFYVVKYITKNQVLDGFYEHLYYVSRGLDTAHPVADCYTFNLNLESALESENDFCSCGWVRDAGWTFPLSSDFESRGGDNYFPDYLVPIPEKCLDDPNLVFVQLSLADWLEMEGSQ